MRIPTPSGRDWPGSVAEAREVQQRLRSRVVTRDAFTRLQSVAGVDIGLARASNEARAAAVVLSYPDCEPLEAATAVVEIGFPYVPGYLSFREIPPIMAALGELARAPDLIICDGQGIAHPRRFGLACHLGVLTGIPTIGAAKSRLVGACEEPEPKRGSWSKLMDGDEVIGAVVRTRDRVSPVFVSPGHRVSLETSVDIVLACCKRYRLPETTRAAHRLASGGRRG